jgi:uridylate kinase
MYHDTKSTPYMGDSTGLRKFRRVLLKLSGEALREPGSTDNISPPIVEDMAAQIKAAHQTGIEIALVVGGGNFWRGVSASNKGMERATADYMGMLATVMNSLALQSMLEAIDVPTRVQSAIEMKNVAEPFIRRVAMRHLELGRVVIFAAGTGNPFFSTDTTAALRASEIGADVVFKATKVDGIYDSDPNKNPDAKRFESVSFQDCLTKQLKVMDATAFSLCQENNMPIVVFSMNEPDNIRRALVGEPLGTVVNATGTL